LRNGLRCMLVTSNLNEDEEDDEDENTNQDDTESVVQ
jgi:hypothetical protein